MDSNSLALLLATGEFQTRLTTWLLDRLHKDGFGTLTASQLSFLGGLDCGQNYASELARGLGITRQAVHKTVRDLEQCGWLATKPDEHLGNQRVIVFTTEGERMMAAARLHFLELDTSLEQEFGANLLIEIGRFLEFEPTI